MTVPSFVKAGGAMVVLAGVAMAGLAVFGPAPEANSSPNADKASTRSVGAVAGGAALSPGSLAAPQPAAPAATSAPIVADARQKLDQALRAGAAAEPQKLAALANPRLASPGTDSPALNSPGVASPMAAATRAVPLVRSLAPPGPAASAAPASAAIADASADVNDLCERARRELLDGSLAGARALLNRAARGGAPRALFMLGETFDPAALSEQGLDAKGDAARARAYYKKAADSGHPDAARRLAALAR